MKDWILNCKTPLMPGCMSLIHIAALPKTPVGHFPPEEKERNGD